MKKVQLGSSVIVEFESGEKEKLQIVSCNEADALASRISADTPFSRAAIGKHEGEKITYPNNRQNTICCQIISIN